MANYDGSIRIDSRIDTSGFDSGVRKMESTAEKASSNIVNKFEDKWKAMDWGGKQAVIEKATASYGNAWNTMGADQQHAALLKIVGDLEKMPEPLEKKVNPALKRMNVYGHGFTRVLNAIVPGMYRMRRSVVGLNEMAVDMDSAAKSGSILSSAIHALPAFLALAAIGVTLLAKVAFNWARKTVNELYNNLSITSAFRDKVVELKTAFDAVKGATQALGASLLNALAPVLLNVIDWLVEAINWVSMFIAALTGQKTVMRYVSGATDSAASSTGKLTKNTKDLKKAAEGALAAFDEINVLQMEKPEEGGGGGGVGGNIVMQEVDVPADFIKTSWESFKDWLNDNILDPIAKRFGDDWEEFKGYGKTAWDSIKEYAKLSWDITVSDAEVVWDSISNYAKLCWETTKEDWDTAWSWFKKNVTEPIGEFFEEVFENISEWASGAWDDIVKVWTTVSDWFKDNVTEPVKNFFIDTWGKISRAPGDAWEYIKMIWRNVNHWFEETVLLPLKRAFETTFSGIETFVKRVINSIIDFINGMISAITTGINAVIRGINSISVTIPSWVPIFGGNTWGMNIPTVTAPQIPRLATGAVIPPNAEFAAILGDQRSGKNLEAPEGLIRQIIQEELGNIQTDVEIKFAGSLGSLVRELKPYIDKENTRIGSSLVKGGGIT